jgi:hypothetical protein
MFTLYAISTIVVAVPYKLSYTLGLKGLVEVAY